MKQYKINRAYESLEKLSMLRLPIKVAYAVYNMIKQIKEPYDFEIQQEKSIIEKYHAEINEDGSVSFKCQEDAIKAQSELNELHNLEHDITIKPLKISMETIRDETITPADIFALEGFIEFEE